MLKPIAAVLSAAVATVSIALDIVALLFSSCVITHSQSGSVWFRFLNQHLIVSSCSSARRWYYCNETVLQDTDEAPHSYANPGSVLVFLLVHLIIHILWLLSVFVLWYGPRDWRAAWHTLTILALMYGIVTAGLFSVEIADAFALSDCTSDVSNYIVAQLILPLYLSYGALLWLVLAIVWFLMCFRQFSSESEDSAKPKPRSLSETEDFPSRLKQRFEQAENIEDQESRMSRDTLVNKTPGPRGDPVYYHGPKDSATGDWVYSNPAFVKSRDFGANRPGRVSEASQELYASMPNTFLHRMTSQNDSEVSESRKIGRPVSMPPLPAIDYPLPRAKVSTSLSRSGGEINQKPTPRKVIRTSSGRSISAMEYLRGGFTPAHKVVSEEEAEHKGTGEDKDGVQRYFVKLKQ